MRLASKKVISKKILNLILRMTKYNHGNDLDHKF